MHWSFVWRSNGLRLLGQMSRPSFARHQKLPRGKRIEGRG